MDTQEIDRKVVDAVFEQAGLVGWRDVNLVEAAREGGVSLADMRRRFPGRTAVLLRFGSLADQAVLDAAPSSGPPRERLFDLLMSRFDMLQRQRAGVLAVMEAARTDPGMAGLLWMATLRSMKWLLDAAGVPSSGPLGLLRVHGLAAVWAYAVRAWEKDDTADLASVMAAVDRGLDRAMQAERMLPGQRGMAESDDAPMEVPPMLPGNVVAEADGGPAVL